MIFEDLSQSLSNFSDFAERAASMGELEALLLALVTPLGYTSVASGLLGADTLNAIHFAKWPPGWIDLYTQRGFIFIDPVPLWAMHSGAAITSGELRKVLPTDHPAHQVFHEGEAFGLFGGYIVPQRASSNVPGLVSFVGAHDPQTSCERLILRGIAGVVFERAEVLSGRPRPDRLVTLPEITDRERECLKCLVEGKNASETARSMNVSEATVRFHISKLHRKTGSKRRSDLVRFAITWSLVKREE